ncbi:MAG TPA: hypothetical protein VFE86_09335 [Ilumatobacteraceae bacterium]|nr:hypothetical protein [Ilumatobacteraceae bacterium]
MRFLGALVAVVGLALTAGPAVAANIVYTKDHNVFVTSPDGGIQRQITTNGAVDNSYRSPTEKDDGTIVVPHSSKFWWLFGLDGSSRGGPWTAFAMNSCSTSPTGSQVSPGGGLIVYTFVYSEICLNYNGQGPTLRTTFANSNSPTADGQYPVYDGYSDARWVPGQSIAAMISGDGDTIGAQSGSGIQGFLFADPNEEFKSFDLSRTGNRMVIVTTTDNATSGPGTLSVWQKDSPPPTPDGHLACISPNAMDWDSEARWSPDGTMITWATSQGVYVSPAPGDNGGGACGLSPRLIAAGGSDPDWGTADVPAQQQQQTPPPQGDTAAPVAKAAAARQRLGKALKKGLVWTVTTNEAGSALVQAKLKKTVVAKKTVKFSKAGTYRVVLKFTKKAKRQLKRKRSVKLVLTTVVSDAAGNKTPLTKRVTLKR